MTITDGLCSIVIQRHYLLVTDDRVIGLAWVSLWIAELVTLQTVRWKIVHYRSCIIIMPNVVVLGQTVWTYVKVIRRENCDNSPLSFQRERSCQIRIDQPFMTSYSWAYLGPFARLTAISVENGIFPPRVYNAPAKGFLIGILKPPWFKITGMILLP